MGAANSALSTSSTSQLAAADEITTVSERIEGEDPILQRIRALKIAAPLVKTPPPSESSLTDILVRKPPSDSSISGSLEPQVLLELFSVYRNWIDEKTKTIGEKQEEIENKMEMADALAVKLQQRYNYSLSAMKTSAHNLSEVHPLQVEVGKLKGRLTEVISNCDALCKRISTGPETLRTSVKPFMTNNADADHSA